MSVSSLGIILGILALRLGRMVGLNLQEADDAFTEILEFLDIRSEHLMQPVEELTAIAAVTHLEDHEVHAALLPVYCWADGKLFGTRASADLGLGQLHRDLSAIPFFHRGAYDPQLGVGEIRDVLHCPCGVAATAQFTHCLPKPASQCPDTSMSKTKTCAYGSYLRRRLVVRRRSGS